MLLFARLGEINPAADRGWLLWAPVLPEQRKVTDGKVDLKRSVSANGAMRTEFAQKLPCRALSSMLGRTQKLLAGWRAVHRINSGHWCLWSAGFLYNLYQPKRAQREAGRLDIANRWHIRTRDLYAAGLYGDLVFGTLSGAVGFEL